MGEENFNLRFNRTPNVGVMQVGGRKGGNSGSGGGLGIGGQGQGHGKPSLKAAANAAIMVGLGGGSGNNNRKPPTKPRKQKTAAVSQSHKMPPLSENHNTKRMVRPPSFGSSGSGEGGRRSR